MLTLHSQCDSAGCIITNLTRLLRFEQRLLLAQTTFTCGYLTKVIFPLWWRLTFDQFAGGGLTSPYISDPSDLFSFSHTRNASRLQSERLQNLRSVTTKGVNATVGEQLEQWKEFAARKGQDPTQSDRQDIHPRIGLGLPMSNVFATYFGGSLDLVSLDGWGTYTFIVWRESNWKIGTDVYVRLPKLVSNKVVVSCWLIMLQGTILEGIEV